MNKINELKKFDFVCIGNLNIEATTDSHSTPILKEPIKVPDEDAAYSYKVPMLKVPDNYDVVKDLWVGAGVIKVSGLLWGEVGHARLQDLRELCKTYRVLAWSAQETDDWLVFPQNVPDINTNEDFPGQYHFELTMECVTRLKKDGAIEATD